MASEISNYDPGSEQPVRRSPGWVYLVLLLVLLWAFGLRMYQLNTRPFWGDEALTGNLVHMGPASVLRTTAPLSFLRQLGTNLGGELVIGWGYQLPLPLLASLTSLIGPQDMLVRLPSFMAGILAVAVAYALGRRLFNTQVGLLLAFLLASASFQIIYSQEARYYSLMFFLSVLGAYLLWRALEENRALFWIGFITVSILNVWNHLFAVFFLAPMALYAGVRLAQRLLTRLRMDAARSRRRALPPRHPTARSRLLHWQQVAWSALRQAPLLYLGTAIAVVALLLLTSEVALPVVRAATGTSATARPINVGFSSGTEGAMAEETGLHGFSLSPASLFELAALFGSGGGWHAVLYLGLAALGVIYVLQTRRWRAGFFLATWLIVPLLMVSLVRSEHFFVEKYIIFVQLPYLAFVALGIYAAWQWVFRRLLAGPLGRFPWPALAATAIVALLIFVNAQPVLAYYRLEDRLNWRGVVAYLQTNLQPTDAVIYATSRMLDAAPFEYYFKLLVDPEQYGDFVLTYENLSAQQLQHIFDTHDRVWIIDHVYRGGFKEIGSLYGGVDPTMVAGVPVYRVNSAPVMTSKVPFTPAPGADIFRSARGVVAGQDLLVALTLDDPTVSEKFAVFLSGEHRGELDPSGLTAPDYVRIPITASQVSSVDIATVSGAPADVYSGTLITVAGTALPDQADTRIEAERYPTDNGFVYDLAEASGGQVVRAQSFNTISRFPLWLSEPGDYLLTLHGRLGARVGTPIWSVVLDRQAIGTMPPKETGNWEDQAIPLRFDQAGLHELVLGVTANAYVENGFADLDYITLQARENWVWRGVAQVDLATATSGGDTNADLTCSSDNTSPGRWLTGEALQVPITVDDSATYVVKTKTASSDTNASFDVTVDELPLGQMRATAGETVTDIFLTELGPGVHRLSIVPTTGVDIEEVCLQSLAIEQVYAPRNDNTLRIAADTIVVGEGAKLQKIGSETAATSAGSGNVIQVGLWFEDTGNYELDVSGLNDRPAPIKLQVELDGKPVGEPLSYDRNDYSWTTQSTLLPIAVPGYHRLRIDFVNDYYDPQLVANKDDGDRNGAVRSFTITRLQAPIISVGKALSLDLTQEINMLGPGSEIVDLEDGPTVQRAGNGRVVDVDLAFDSPGGYRLTVQGQNDRPGPVELNVLVDEVEVGTLRFAADDSSWSDETLLFTVALPGYHRVSLDYVNDVYDDSLFEQGLDGDRNVGLRQLTLSKVPAAIAKDDVTLDLNFDDILADVGDTQITMARVDGEFAMVFEPGHELQIPTAFLDSGVYVIEIVGRSERLTGNLDFKLGDTARTLEFGSTSESHFIGVEQPAGVSTFTLRNTGEQNVYVQALRLYANPLFASDAFAWTPEQGYIATGAELGEDNGREAVIRGGAGSLVDIPVIFPKTGVYRVSVRGQHDRPGPVVLNVLVDDVRKGQIYFSDNDGSWSERTVQITVAEPGLHTMTIAFDNDYYDQQMFNAGQDGDRNALIDRVVVVPVGS